MEPSGPVQACNGTALPLGDRGGTVVKVLCYKSEGRWFDSRWCHSDRTMALGSTQTLTEMSTRSISLGVKAASA
jgi:hypothetical protein